MIKSSNQTIQTGTHAYFVPLTPDLPPVDSRAAMTFNEKPEVNNQLASNASPLTPGGSSPVSVTMSSKSRQEPPPSSIDQLKKKLFDEQQRQQERRIHIHAQGLQDQLTVLKTQVLKQQETGENTNDNSLSNLEANSVEGLLKRISDLEGRLSVSNQVTAFLQTESRSRKSDWVAQAKTAEFECRVRDLKAELCAKDEEILNQEKKCADQAAVILELQGGLMVMEERVKNSQERSINETDQRLTELQHRLKCVMSNEQVLKQMTMQSEEERQNQQEKAKILETQLESLRLELQKKEENGQEVSDLRIRLGSATADAQILQEMGARAEEERQKQEERANILQTQLEELRGEVNRNLAELGLANQRFNEQSCLSKELVQQISQLEDRLKLLAIDNQRLKTSTSQAEALTAENARQLHQSNSQLERIQNSLLNKESEIEDFKRKESDYIRRIQELEKDMSDRVDAITTRNNHGLAELSKQVVDMEALLVEVKGEANSRKERLEKVEVENQFYETKTKELGQQVFNLKALLTEKEADLAAREQECLAHASRITELQGFDKKLLNEFTKQTADMEALLQEVKREADLRKERLEQVEQSNYFYQTKNQELKDQEEALMTSLKQKESEMAVLQQQCSEHSSKIEELMKNSSSYDKDDFKKQTSEMESMLTAVKQEADLRQNRLSEMENEKKVSESKLKGLEAELDKARNDIHDIEAQLVTLSEKCQQQDNLILKLRTANDQDQHQSTDFSKKAADLELLVIEIRNEADIRQGRLQQIEEEKRISDKRTEELEAESMALKATIAEKEKEIMLRDRRYSEQVTTIEALQLEMDKMEQELNQSYNQTLDELMKHIAELESCLKASQQEADTLRASASQLDKERDSNQVKTQELEDQILSLKEQLNEKEDQEKIRSQELVQQLEAQVDDLKTSLQATLSLLAEEKQTNDIKFRQFEAELGTSESKIREMEVQLEARDKKALEQVITAMEGVAKYSSALEARLHSSEQEIQTLRTLSSQAKLLERSRLRNRRRIMIAIISIAITSVIIVLGIQHRLVATEFSEESPQQTESIPLIQELEQMNDSTATPLVIPEAPEPLVFEKPMDDPSQTVANALRDRSVLGFYSGLLALAANKFGSTYGDPLDALTSASPLHGYESDGRGVAESLVGALGRASLFDMYRSKGAHTDNVLRLDMIDEVDGGSESDMRMTPKSRVGITEMYIDAESIPLLWEGANLVPHDANSDTGTTDAPVVQKQDEINITSMLLTGESTQETSSQLTL